MGLHGEAERHDSHASELILQVIAALLALAGVAIAHLRYGGKRRSGLAAAPAGPVEFFFLNGWRFDDLYALLFVRPFKALSRMLWERVDEGVIDDSLDRLAKLLGRHRAGVRQLDDREGVALPAEPGWRGWR